MREGGLKAKIASALGLDCIPIVQVDSNSMNEIARKVTGSVLAVEEVTIKTLAPSISGGNVYVQIKDKDVSDVASSPMGLAEEIVWVAGELKDWFTIHCALLLFLILV